MQSQTIKYRARQLNIDFGPIISSVANFWQKISAKSTEKFGRWLKNSAAHIIL
jgi:hypothetical protein